MKVTPGDRILRGVVLLCCLAACALFRPAAARAGLSGSRHDWVGGPQKMTTLPNATVPNGMCSACHVAHRGNAGGKLWSRGMTNEVSYFNQTSNPDYVRGATLMCYDCHDNANSSTVDNDPDTNLWKLGYKAQDIAFTDGPPSQGGTKVGYYELIDGYPPGPGHTPPVNPSPPTPAPPTGGHYWKSIPNPAGVPAYEQGDKLACEMCHDPHNAGTGTNEAMLLTSTSDGLGGSVTIGNGLKASPNGLNNYVRTGTGREMCAGCHSYSDGALPPVTLWGVQVPRPTVKRPQHKQLDATPCTNCHLHNRIVASCTDCHGDPPATGAHQRHLDALGAATPSISFACEICHGPHPGSNLNTAESWHNEGNGVVSTANVDVIGQDAFWNPTPPGSRSPGYAGVASTVSPVPAGYAFTRKGGGNKQCFDLACHGNAPQTGASGVILKWGDTMLDGSGNFTGNGALICKWCHSGAPARPATIDGSIYAPNVVGNLQVVPAKTNAAANWGAEVNGHGVGLSGAVSAYDLNTVGDGASTRTAAAKDCDKCHDGSYSSGAPLKAHYDGSAGSSQKRLKDAINTRTLATLIGSPGGGYPSQVKNLADAACYACHSSGAAGGDSGTQIATHTTETGPYASQGRLEAPFTRVCRQCHDVHGANWNEITSGRNLTMVGKWVDNRSGGTPGLAESGESARVDYNNDGVITAGARPGNDGTEPIVFTARSGANSFDTANAAPDRNICFTCHTAAPPTSGTGGGAHLGSTSMSSDERGNDCTLCHAHMDATNQLAHPVYSWNGAFVPSGCEGCHGKDGKVHPGKSGVYAPNVVSALSGATWLSVYDGSWYRDAHGSGTALQVGGHGDAAGREGGNKTLVPSCTSCHDISTPAGTHFDGVYNSVGTEKPSIGNPTTRLKGSPNANTSHLKPGFFTDYPANPPSGQAYAQQVAMDGYCYQKCHQTATPTPVAYMGHMSNVKLGQPLLPDYGAVQMGTHLTKSATSDIVAIPYPFDKDLTTNASQPGYYAPCVSCHDPHGTTLSGDYPGKESTTTNHMVRDHWIIDPNPLCKYCHI